jgi:peptide/nickel transport system substrate-binding protein
MLKRFTWALLTCLMIISLFLVSCSTTDETGGKVTEEDTGQKITIGEEEKTEEETVEQEEGFLSPDVPKYGGTLHIYMPDPVGGFDEAFNMGHVGGMVTTTFFTNQQMLQGDWTKGPAGTGEQDWVNGFAGRCELLTGQLAESWEFPDNETIIFHIRHGVHYQDKAPANGREYTAEDAAYNMNRIWEASGSYPHLVYPPQYRPTSITALDKYTVEIKVPETMHGQLFLVCGGFLFADYPPEAIEQYGDMANWENACGTGPWMLTDYVNSSSMNFVRNPDYWQYDPLHPENQLPYMDAVKTLNISDLSTRLAAVRTGKFTTLGAISWEDASSLIKTSPDIIYNKSLTGPTCPIGRLDKPELPFHDIKVRQALSMAIDREALIEDYYEGNATLFAFPWPPATTYSAFYTPLEEQSQFVQDLFTYNPERAKQLLSEAGYPDGFKTSIICISSQADFLSIIKEYFAAINVELDINVVELGVMTSMDRGRTYPEMIFKGLVQDYQFPWRMLFLRIESPDNVALVDDPYFRAPYEDMCRLVGIDDARINTLLKDVGKKSLELAWAVWLPGVDIYTFWWPWLQNFYASGWGGYYTPDDWTMYCWIDKDMKKTMGY